MTMLHMMLIKRISKSSMILLQESWRFICVALYIAWLIGIKFKLLLEIASYRLNDLLLDFR